MQLVSGQANGLQPFTDNSTDTIMMELGGVFFHSLSAVAFCIYPWVILGRGTIRTKASAQERAHSTFLVRPHRHNFDPKKQAADPPNNHSFDFHWYILVWKGKTNNELHSWYDLMIAEYTKPVSAEVHDGSFSEKVTTHIKRFTANGDPVIGTNHKLAGRSHAFITLSRSNFHIE